MHQTFAALADPRRLQLVAILRRGPHSVTALQQRLRIPQPSVSKHLKTLREAGLVSVEVKARQRLYRLTPAPLQSVDAWLAPYRDFWSARLDALEARLAALPDPIPTPPPRKR